MITVYEFNGRLFETIAAAKEASAKTPKEVGAAFGGIDRSIRPVKVFRNAQEWSRYTGGWG